MFFARSFSEASARTPQAPHRTEVLEPGSNATSHSYGLQWDDWSSKGQYSLELNLHRAREFEFTYGELESLPKWIRLDTMIPPSLDADELAGHVDLLVSCPEKHIENIYIDSLMLADMDQGAFFTGAFEVSDAIRAEFGGGCRHAACRIEVHTNPDLGFLLFDRFELGSFSVVNHRRLCGYPEIDINKSIQLQNGLMDFQLWRQNVSYLEGFRQLSKTAEKIDGSLGLSFDNDRRIVSIVVDRSKYRKCGLKSLRKRIERLELPFDVSIRPSCKSTRRLSGLYRKLRDARAFPEGTPPSYVEQDSSQLIILVPTEHVHKAKRHLKRWRGMYRLIPTSARLTAGSRYRDTQPHFGAAAISRGLKSCTAGFIVRDAVFGRGAVTAGHCFTLDKNASEFEKGVSSSYETYGTQGYTPYLASASIPSWDVAFIRPEGEVFSREARIHTDPGYPSSRKVKGATAPIQGDLVCVSGRTRGSRCGIQIIGKVGEDVDLSHKLTRGLWIAESFDASQPVLRDGDSGGPIYRRLGGSDASIVGMAVGDNLERRSLMYFYPVADVLTQLGVEIETAP